MGEKSIEVSLAELTTTMKGVEKGLGEVGKKVEDTHASVIVLQHQIKDLDQIRSEMDRMKEDITDLRMKTVRYSTAAGIAALVIGWIGNGYVTQTVKDAVSKNTVTLATPSGK